ncbi:MAG: Golgi Transport [Phylliscum demangeonii]|nr:MAG: Golgi Transport [Phylliscum demangeonii]
MSTWLTDTQKIGVAFCSGGGLAMGNILFLIGLPITIGPHKTLAFFSRRQKLRGTVAFGIGIFWILFVRWFAFVGFFVELYGIAILFGDFLFTLARYVGAVPVVGRYLARALDVLAAGAGRRNADLPV